MFKQVDVAPIMTFAGKARAVPCSVIFKIDPVQMAGQPFHIIIFTKIVEGVTVLGGSSFWTPDELAENVARVGGMMQLKNQFKTDVQAQLTAGGVIPQTVAPTTVDGTAPNEVLATTTGEVLPVVPASAPVEVDDAQAILDIIATTKE